MKYINYLCEHLTNNMATGDVTVPQNGGQGSVKLHPHVLAVLRWCISCIWSTASELLQRLLASPSPHIKAIKPKDCQSCPAKKTWTLRSKTPQRQASNEHISPVPKVDCEILYAPEGERGLDIIFVHGLYGSLANTWRQGDWKQKYKWGPKRVPLKRPTTIPSSCEHCDNELNAPEIQINFKKYDFCMCDYSNKNKLENNNMKDDKNINNDNKNTIVDFKDNEEMQLITESDSFITEEMLENDLLESVEIVDNYEAQAKFVRDLFRNQNGCDNMCDVGKADLNEKQCDCEKCNENTDENNTTTNDFNLEIKDMNSNDNKIENLCDCKECKDKISENVKKCPIGCGCICEKCYSPCWPKDWLQIDYPDARIISINYTSDPYLWRPVWIKESKRLQLHERAEQMTEQLLNLGVGEKPIIWVGHSKGGLFIKQIYAEAYEAHMKLSNTTDNSDTSESKINEKCNEAFIDHNINIEENKSTTNNNELTDNSISEDSVTVNELREDITNYIEFDFKKENITKANFENTIEKTNNLLENLQFIMENTENDNNKVINSDVTSDTSDVKVIEDDRRASLWYKSSGFMFYSVPHRGSSLADIVLAPLMMRSVELLEISKDCSLVLKLQDRWLTATASSRPMVRSLVETCRTLMSVLWLRIVSVESADAGIGALCGVSVDHREICKPSSRSCLLYKELLNVIHNALNKCRS